MISNEETQKIRKTNMKIFPTYKKLSWDFIFFYTINFLFLTQVKGINPADIVLIDSFYYLFGVITQVPATFIIQFFGRKNSIIIANVLNCIYMIVIICSKNLFNLIVAEIICSLAFAIKESAEPSLLNESIPPTKKKSQIFAKINQKGISGYYAINSISTILAGFLYNVNPYIPISLSLSVLVIVTVLSTLFIEPVEKRNEKDKIDNISQIQELKESFKFVLKSERVKSLILFSTLMTGILSVLSNYEISLVEDLNISSAYLGILFAILGIISSISTKKQEKFHTKFRNKSLSVLGFLVIISCILSGVAGEIAKQFKIVIVFIILFYVVKYFCVGIYNALIEKYLSNFTNEEIDTKVFTANNFIRSFSSAIIGTMAAFLLDRMETAMCMIVIGCIFFILMIILNRYMKKRVGLKPEEYSKEEIKYDKLKEIV